MAEAVKFGYPIRSNIISFLPEPSIIFHHGTWSCDSMTYVFPLVPNSSSKDRKEKKRKEKKRKEKQTR